MEDTITIRDILSSFFRQFRTFCWVFATAIIIGIATIIFSQTLYFSSGSVLIKFGSDADAGVNETNKNNQQSSQNDRREMIQSNIDIIQSHDLLKSVLEKLGIERVYPDIAEKPDSPSMKMENAIKTLKTQHLVIKSGSQSNLVEISALNASPEMAAEVVSTIQNVFIARQLEIFNKPQTEFLEEQVKISQERLNKSQQELRDFKNNAGISSIEEEVNELLKQKSNANNVAFQSIDDTQTKLEELRDKEAEMLTTYRSGSPALKALRRSIAETERQLKERQKNLSESSEKSSLAQHNSSVNKRIAELEELRGRYNDLLRQTEVDEASYKNYLKRSEEARVNANLGERKITSVVVVDAPIVPLKPARPRKLLTLAISIIAGGVFGLITVLVKEIFDERFRTPRQLAKALDVPVLADFPKKDGMTQLFNSIEHLIAGNQAPIIQIASSYESENVERLARDLASFATAQGKKVLLANTKDIQKNLQQTHFSFVQSNQYGWIIVPNSGVLNDELGQSLAKLADATILVAEAENTRAPVAQEVKRLINSLGGKVIGAVLVGRRLYIPEFVYKIFYNNKN